MTLLLAVLGATLTVVAVVDLPPAAAASLPPIYCRASAATPKFNYCIGSTAQGEVNAGLINTSATGWWTISGGRVELSYHAFTDPLGPNKGGAILAQSGVVNGVAPGGNVSTPLVVSWRAGIYCVRMYFPGANWWHDYMCIDTNGNVSTYF